MKAERQINVKLKYLRNLEKSHANLLRACKDWVQWFEYVSAYQNENLGHGLKEAEENWKSMTNPSPDISKMKKAVLEAQEYLFT